jgi:hypothetical protein
VHVVILTSSSCCPQGHRSLFPANRRGDHARPCVAGSQSRTLVIERRATSSKSSTERSREPG